MTQQQSLPSIGIGYAGPTQKPRAFLLARELGFPIAAEEVEQYDLILRCTDTGLELFRPGDPQLTGPVRAEFVSGPSGYRRNHGGTEMLIRAIGHKKNVQTRVLDATGGLGRDAFIMACHGCRVRIAEKNIVAAALLEDGLRRAAALPETEKICRRISLTAGNSIDLLREENKKGVFDVIYLDPMFPMRSKSALVKKELQILQQLVGSGDDTGELLEIALRTAGKRVVVKRPKDAPPLPGPNPSFSLGGKAIRFDVYLTAPG